MAALVARFNVEGLAAVVARHGGGHPRDMAYGIMPLYTPVSSSWLNMAESIQRILVGRALAGAAPDPTRPDQPIQRLEAVARGWNVAPTPFVWSGKQVFRRQQARERRYHHERFRSRDSPTDSTSGDR